MQADEDAGDDFIVDDTVQIYSQWHSSSSSTRAKRRRRRPSVLQYKVTEFGNTDEDEAIDADGEVCRVIPPPFPAVSSSSSWGAVHQKPQRRAPVATHDSHKFSSASTMTDSHAQVPIPSYGSAMQFNMRGSAGVLPRYSTTERRLTRAQRNPQKKRKVYTMADSDEDEEHYQSGAEKDEVDSDGTDRCGSDDDGSVNGSAKDHEDELERDTHMRIPHVSDHEEEGVGSASRMRSSDLEHDVKEQCRVDLKLRNLERIEAGKSVAPTAPQEPPSKAAQYGTVDLFSDKVSTFVSRPAHVGDVQADSEPESWSSEIINEFSNSNELVTDFQIPSDKQEITNEETPCVSQDLKACDKTSEKKFTLSSVFSSDNSHKSIEKDGIRQDEPHSSRKVTNKQVDTEKLDKSSERSISPRRSTRKSVQTKKLSDTFKRRKIPARNASAKKHRISSRVGSKRRGGKRTLGKRGKNR